MAPQDPRQERATSLETDEQRHALDPESIRAWRERFDKAEREKARIRRRLDKIRKLRRQLIGP